MIAGDGWSSSWTVESGWIWNGYLPSVWYYWGNGKREGTEGCDDGNTDIIFIIIDKLIFYFILAIVLLFV